MIGKRETIFAAGGFLLAIVLAGGGLWWHGHRQDSARLAGSQTVGNHLVSLDQSSSAAGGLSVSGSGANDLGQLGADKTSQGTGGSSSSAGSNSSGGLDQLKLFLFRNVTYAKIP